MSEKSGNLISETRQRVVNTSWLEWQDSDLNNEKWEAPKNGPDGLFVDGERVRMPRSLEPYRWMRAKNLEYLTGPLTVHTTGVEHFDLITSNKHLLHSEFVRSLISALTNLQYCGREGLEISGEGPNFVWNCRNESWHGWMHVYSLNKAGKGVQHRPMINPNGKYVIRLHCMGCWRRIVVDDTVPVDKNGTPLLPRTSNNVELWPMLLAKAMLKIASLSWTENCEIVDFYPISCLTGWTCLSLNIAHLSLKDKWNFLTRYVERFEWTLQAAGDYVSEGAKNDEKVNATAMIAETEKPQPTALLLHLRDTRELGSDAVPGLSPCRDHAVLVVQSRDIPLDPKDVKPPLEKWKLHRWLNWAISRNIIDPADYFIPTRYLKMISALRECDDSLAHNRHEADEVKEGSIFPSEVKELDKAERKAKSRRSVDSSVTKEKSTDGIDRWIDFNRMAPYATEVHLFYKRENFRHSVQMTSDTVKTINGDHKVAVAKEKKGENKDSTSGKSQMSRHQLVYLLCDSPRKKFFLVNLCALPTEEDAESYGKSYLVLEGHNWFSRPIKSENAVTISTTGNKSTVVELEAGRQLLRIHSSSEFLAIVSSDTIFHLGNQTAVQQLMTVESIRTEQLSRAISESLRQAYRSLGTQGYPAALRNYYRSYMPLSLNNTSGKNKKLRALIHYFFMEEQVRLIDETFPKEEVKEMLRTLRVFFLDPNIRLRYFDLTRPQDILQNSTIKGTAKGTYSRSANSPEKMLDYDRAATIIQSFFRMALVKIYKQLHNFSHAWNASVCERLSKISDRFDLSVTNRLLRNVIERHHSSLHDLYPCAEDFIHVLNFQDFTGVLRNMYSNEQWFPIARFVVNPKLSERVFAAFELLINLPRFALRVFRNDDRREMKHVMNHVAPDYYEYRPAGYTVFAYSWGEKRHSREIDWIVRVVTVKGQPVFRQLDTKFVSSFLIEPPGLTVEESVVAYIPNIRNCISRWILRTTAGTLVSIRLKASYSEAQVKIKITDEAGDVLADVTGGSTILLPLLILGRSVQNERNHEAGSTEVNEGFRNITIEKKEYYIEAFVLNDSWPLTDAEWTIVSQMKTGSMKDLEARMKFENQDTQILELPRCFLQVVVNTSNDLEVFRDNRREQEIALLKESWREDGDRAERGRQLRESFLNEHATKVEAEVSSEHADGQSEITEDADAVFCLSHDRQRRTLRPPESHHLPTLDLMRYARANENMRGRRVRTEREYELLKARLAASIVDSQKKHADSMENLVRLANQRFRKYAKLLAVREASFWERRTLVDAAYESRGAYVGTSKEKVGRTGGRRN